MQSNPPKTTEQEVCEVFGWSEPNIFVRLVVQAIERVQSCYETYPAGGQPTEPPQGRAETAAQLKMELALLRQLKEAMQICVLARKTMTYVQKHGQASVRASAPAPAPVLNKPPTKGEIYRIPDEKSAPSVPFTTYLKQMLPTSVIGRHAEKAAQSESKKESA